SLSLAWTSPPDLAPDSASRRRDSMVRHLAFAVLNRRLASLARSEAPPFVSAGVYRSTDLRALDVAQMYAGVRPGEWRAALNALVVERRRILEHGISDAEMRREVAE